MQAAGGLADDLAGVGHRQRTVPRDELVGPDAVDVLHHQVVDASLGVEESIATTMFGCSSAPTALISL